MTESFVRNLKQICLELKEDEEPIDKNFWAVNMHGDELMEDFVVPEGVRIIMFCYSGRKLNICPRFDKFNWREIFLNEDASFNYCTFLSNLVQYSSLRDHFCVYESGNTVRDLLLTQDSDFRSGIYELPVYAAVHEPNTDEVYVSSSEIFNKAIAKTDKIKRISVNRQMTAKIAKDKNSDTIIFSKHINIPKIRLSILARKLLLEKGSGFTLLLLTCRTGEQRRGVIHPPTVYEEVEKLVIKYSK